MSRTDVVSTRHTCQVLETLRADAPQGEACQVFTLSAIKRQSGFLRETRFVV